MSQGRDEVVIDGVLRGDGDRPRVCTIVGPAGIGKTELVRRVRRRWRAGERRVVRIVGSELERDAPLGGVAQLLAQLDQAPTAASDDAAEENAERRVSAMVLRALDRLGERESLVVIDDAHWLDETSQRIFDFALRQLDDEAPPTLIAERPGRSLTTVGHRHPVSGLSPDETVTLVERHPNGRVTDAAILHELSEGNPLHLRELLVAGGDLPASDDLHRRLIRRRIDRLDGPTQLALTLLARGRHGDDLDGAWEALATARADIGGELHDRQRSAETFIDAIRPAADAGLVETTTRGIAAFVHPEYRTIAASAVDGETQRSVAEALAAAATDPDSAAWHRSDAVAGTDDEVSDLLAAVGRRHAERGLPIEAARAFEAAAARAADPAVALDRRLDAAHHWWYAGEPADVARVTADADTLPVDQLRRLRARRLHRAAVGWHGQVETTIRGMLDDADLAAEFSVDDASSFRLAAFIEACHAGRIDQAGEIADALATGLDDDTVEAWSGASAVCTAFAALLAGDVDGIDAPELAVLEFAATLDPRKLETPALNVLQIAGYALMVTERWDAAADTLAGLSTEEHARGASVMIDFTDATRAELDRRRGRWASAASRCTDRTTIDADHLGAGPALQRAIRARMLACRGEPATLDFVTAVHDEAGPVGMVSITGVADIASATYHLVTGEPDVAADAMEALEQRVLEGGAIESGVLWHELDAIESFAAADRPDSLRRLVGRLDRHSQLTARRWSVACSRLGHLVLGHDVEPSDVLASADELGDAFEASRIRLLVAEHTLDQFGLGRLADLDLDLDDLRRRVARFGALPFADRCDRVAGAVGSGRRFGAGGSGRHHDRSDRPAGSAVGTSASTGEATVLTELTPAELRVAVSVATGRTNAEAADELFLSVRTVEAHLRAIFRKLDVRNRVELATAMVGHVSD